METLSYEDLLKRETSRRKQTQEASRKYYKKIYKPDDENLSDEQKAKIQARKDKYKKRYQEKKDEYKVRNKLYREQRKLKKQKELEEQLKKQLIEIDTDESS